MFVTKTRYLMKIKKTAYFVLSLCFLLHKKTKCEKHIDAGNNNCDIANCFSCTSFFITVLSGNSQNKSDKTEYHWEYKCAYCQSITFFCHNTIPFLLFFSFYTPFIVLNFSLFFFCSICGEQKAAVFQIQEYCGFAVWKTKKACRKYPCMPESIQNKNRTLPGTCQRPDQEPTSKCTKASGKTCWYDGPTGTIHPILTQTWF